MLQLLWRRLRLFHRKLVAVVVAVMEVLDIRDPLRQSLFAEFAAVEAAAVLVVAVAVEAAAVVPSQICNCSSSITNSIRYK